uniref:ArsR/SmtB family transcription factor n=1 Tax=Marinobacterium profundum TaxID=1714300 RepID=UPI0008375AAE|nr:helix-turn-helix transcriptional regulator [Marinobacterium profundum]
MSTDVSEALKSLDNPMRLAILNWLKDPRKHFPEQEIDPEEVGVCVSIIQKRVGLSQSTVSLYLTALQRAQLVTSQRIGPWTYYKRHDQNISAFIEALRSLI